MGPLDPGPWAGSPPVRLTPHGEHPPTSRRSPGLGTNSPEGSAGCLASSRDCCPASILQGAELSGLRREAWLRRSPPPTCMVLMATGGLAGGGWAPGRSRWAEGTGEGGWDRTRLRATPALGGLGQVCKTKARPASLQGARHTWGRVGKASVDPSPGLLSRDSGLSGGGRELGTFPPTRGDLGQMGQGQEPRTGRSDTDTQ